MSGKQPELPEAKYCGDASFCDCRRRAEATTPPLSPVPAEASEIDFEALIATIDYCSAVWQTDRNDESKNELTDARDVLLDAIARQQTELAGLRKLRDDLIATLQTISNMRDMTILGCGCQREEADFPRCCDAKARRAHENGAHKAFGQAADTADFAISRALELKP